MLLQYAAPVSYGELRSVLATAAERVKRDGASTVFSAQDLAVDERTQRVGVRGPLTTFISDRRVSEVSKGYAIELQYAGGRIFLKAFRETSPNDPLEIPLSPSFAWLLLLALAASLAASPRWRCRSSTRATARPCSPRSRARR